MKEVLAFIGVPVENEQMTFEDLELKERETND